DILYQNDISLYAAHLPLDAHPESGNNAQLLNLLGAKPTGTFCEYNGKSISFIGEFDKPTTVEKIGQLLDTTLNTRCRILPFGPTTVRTVALVGGGGSLRDFNTALDMGVDLYLTGDATEIYHNARDGGMHVIFAGHHATETVGVKALAGVIGNKFGIKTEFVDIKTGL
ncbi:MAG: Nif3-like dinuclear metal center hexameric protein, partial [Chitinivibrionales bacterium]|nr:Nif3-like dinuclear metal center hexameric protein [Chitinivibrionales bacterium]MBD3355734.1 Nif3-like dinuclear metal center hexameric protein [Chitinivibrionales bacterium]